jgi:hypothetical protein
MERRITSKPDWTIGRDDRGQAILEWRFEPDEETDFGATYDDVLDALRAPELTLQDELPEHSRGGFDPYDRGSSRPARRDK